MQVPGYDIIKEIGKGGMATVYLAHQNSLERNVVLKVMDEVSAEQSADRTQRFIAEGRIVASLRHPNIITIFDIGVSEQRFYIAMEYLDGGHLKQRMQLPIAPERALGFLYKIASALGEAHQHGIVHRDIKPANILFRDDDTPVLTDFGIAKQIDNDAELTSTGMFLGSPSYASPEQADGAGIDGRTDIYSLGCVFHELLTGAKPYVSTSIVEIMIQHKQAKVPRLPAKLKAYQGLLNTMMAKDPDQRFADVGALLAAIARLGQDLNLNIGVDGGAAAARARRGKQALAALLLTGLVLFSSLHYVEIKLKSNGSMAQAASTQSVIQAPIVLPLAGAGGQAITTDITNDTARLAIPPARDATIGPDPADQPAVGAADELGAQAGPAIDEASVDDASNSGRKSAPALEPGPGAAEVLTALMWLGRQSLADLRLTYPPKDNAYYYFTRLLAIEPGNTQAIDGIYRIAEQYGVLAERALANNERERGRAYIEIGLRIDPENITLLSLQPLLANGKPPSLLDTVKNWF